MALTPKELGQRLKHIRETKQITQESAAVALGISRTAIALVESGSRTINTVQLEKLAKFYGRDVGDFFVSEKEHDRVAVAVSFRIKEELKQKISKTMLDTHIKLLKEYSQLEKLLSLDSKFKHPVKYDLPEPKNVWEAIEFGQKIAENERQRLQLGTRPIKDIAELLEIQGVRVLDIDMDEDISGIFMGDDQIGLSILVNPKHHASRHAFTLAHEYCHVLVDRSRAFLVSNIQAGKDLVEIRANAFAAAFLLPKAGVEEFFQSLGKTGSTRTYLSIAGAGKEKPHIAEQRRSAKAVEIQLYDVVHLQHHYGVSWDAVVYRLQNLGIISKDECHDLLSKKEEANTLRRIINVKLADSAAERKFESHDFAVRFFCLGIDAYRQDIISLKRLEELMVMIEVDSTQLRRVLKKMTGVKKTAD